MAFTAAQFLQSLLQSITAYYTATYSSDTDLYELLSMYSVELASGSTALETVRNNLFVVACENSKLYDNFGTYFQQAKYFEQNYDEDRYVSGSGAFKFTTPAQYTTEESTVFKDWALASCDVGLSVTNFPYSLASSTAASTQNIAAIYGSIHSYSSQGTFTPATRLVDGEVTNSYLATGATNEWVIIDLGTAYDVLGFVTWGASLTTIDNSVKNYRIGLSNTGTADGDFSIVVSGQVPEPTSETVFSDTSTISLTTARYIKFYLDDNWGGSAVGSSEIEVTAAGGSSATPAGVPLTKAALVGDKLYATCFAVDNIDDPIRLTSYDISENTWNTVPTVLGTANGGKNWAKLTGNTLIPMGIIAYSLYLGSGKYASKGLFSFDIYPSEYVIDSGWGRTDLVAVTYSNLDTVPTCTRTNSILKTDDLQSSTSSIAYTESVIFHDKMYMALTVKSDEDAPDVTHKWPFLVYYNPGDGTVGETGLATVTESDYSTEDWSVTAIVVHNNKIYLDIFYESGGTVYHKMPVYNGISWDTSLTALGTAVVDMVSYNNELYAVSSETIKKYDEDVDTWSTHFTLPTTITGHKFMIYAGYLILSTLKGYIYYLDTADDTWKIHYQISGIDNCGIIQFEAINDSLYCLLNNGWYTSEFLENSITAYIHIGAGISGSTAQWAAIPAYRKQLDFMLEAAMNGSTLYGMTRAANAFTLVNPDIRELYDLPQWKLKTFSDLVTQLSTNVWQFAGTSWRTGLWAGAHTTFSGSAPVDKVAAGYVVMVNDNNTITIGPIYDNNLLFDFRRP